MLVKGAPGGGVHELRGLKILGADPVIQKVIFR